jgi:hypothetical protein
MDAKRLQEIRERTEAATPGPWKFEIDDTFRKYDFIVRTAYDVPSDSPDIEVVIRNHVGKEIGDKDYLSNFEFIAHARQDIPDLVAEVERLRAVLETLANVDNYKLYDSECVELNAEGDTWYPWAYAANALKGKS